MLLKEKIFNEFKEKLDKSFSSSQITTLKNIVNNKEAYLKKIELLDKLAECCDKLDFDASTKVELKEINNAIFERLTQCLIEEIESIFKTNVVCESTGYHGEYMLTIPFGKLNEENITLIWSASSLKVKVKPFEYNTGIKCSKNLDKYIRREKDIKRVLNDRNEDEIFILCRSKEQLDMLYKNTLEEIRKIENCPSDINMLNELKNMIPALEALYKQDSWFFNNKKVFDNLKAKEEIKNICRLYNIKIII